jgi:hypothetical protein
MRWEVSVNEDHLIALLRRMTFVKISQTVWDVYRTVNTDSRDRLAIAIIVKTDKGMAYRAIGLHGNTFEMDLEQTLHHCRGLSLVDFYESLQHIGDRTLINGLQLLMVSQALDGESQGTPDNNPKKWSIL